MATFFNISLNLIKRLYQRNNNVNIKKNATEGLNVNSNHKAVLTMSTSSSCLHVIITGLPVRPSHKMGFRSSVSKSGLRGRKGTRVWYRETMFSQMVSYEFLLHGALHGYFLYLVCAPPEKPIRGCEPEEGYLCCSKRFDHGSHSIIFLLFEFKSVR